MTLQSSGAISIADIASELGISANGLTLNDAGPRALAGVSSGPISLANFYGKSNASVSTPSFNGTNFTGSGGNNTDSVGLYLDVGAGWSIIGAVDGLLAAGTFGTPSSAQYQYQVTSAVKNSGTVSGTGSTSMSGTVGWTTITGKILVAQVYAGASGSGTKLTWRSTISSTFTIQLRPLNNQSSVATATITLTDSATTSIA